MAAVASELLWIQTLLSELKITHLTPIIHCDNQSAVALSHNPVLHARTKHMELDLFFVRERVLSKTLLVCHVPADLQTADILTKALSPTRFLELKSKLKVSDPALLSQPP